MAGTEMIENDAMKPAIVVRLLPASYRLFYRLPAKAEALERPRTLATGTNCCRLLMLMNACK
jgi:hypothetical protein